jgi:glycosyltransferase involved in cell wall biosynthesis
MSLKPQAKVAHLTSVHTATDPRIVFKECRSLAESGYDVVLVSPGAKAQMPSGIRHVTVASPRNRLARLLVTTWQVIWKGLRTRARLYHLHDPELIPGGLLLKALGKIVIYDAHEHLPRQVLGKAWIPSLLRPAASWFAGAIERTAGRWLDGVVAANPTDPERFGPRPIVLVQNYVRTEEFRPLPDARPYAEREPLVVCAGGLTGARGLWEMVAAIRLVDHPGARLLLAGRFDAEIRQAVDRDLDSGRVVLLGWRSPAEVRDLLASARVGLSVLHPYPNYMGNYPTKLFEYMAAGLPAVVSDFPMWRDIVNGAGCGIAVDPLDAGAIAAAITQLLNDPLTAEEMGRRGQSAAKSIYSWESQEAALLGLYRRSLRLPEHEPVGK